MNSLFLRSLTSGRLRWAPEVEYALSRGWALEFELPMEGRRIEDYKIAAQKTFGRLANKRFIHGWQGFVEWERDGARWNTNPGLHLRPPISSPVVDGVAQRRTGRGRQDRAPGAGQQSHRVLRCSPPVDHGIETNLLQGQKTVGALRILPQAHWKMPRRFHLQFSMGVESQRGVGSNAVASWRIIREL